MIHVQWWPISGDLIFLNTNKIMFGGRLVMACLKNGQSRPIFLFQQFPTKNCGVWTQIVDVEGQFADHLTMQVQMMATATDKNTKMQKNTVS